MATDLTDAQWEVLQGPLPGRARTGRPRSNDRRTLNGILSGLRPGCRWQDLPERYGCPTTGWRRLWRWQEEGVWDALWQRLVATLDQQGKVGWARAFLDGSFVPAKRGERRWGSPAGARAPR